ncbi:MAG: apolipoprotein N-acyltransferase, partial [Planctomycetales bacterium]|nr:apolipoprotein N-acyltransferase [Planctomycetales bacterium]
VVLLVGAAVAATSWIDERAFVAAWIGMILFFVAVRPLSGKKAFAAGLLFGLTFMSVALHWAPRMLSYTLDCGERMATPWLAFLAIACWEAIPFALIAATSARQGTVPCWACAGVWIAMERFWPRVFPWSFAHTQTGFLPMVQAAELGGQYLVSFVFVYACLDVADRLYRRDFALKWATCAPLALVAANVAFGVSRLATLTDIQERQPTLRIGVVQVDPSFVESTMKMRAVSDQLPPVELMLWPESSLGSYSAAIERLSDVRQDTKIAHMPFIDSKPACGLGAWLLAGGKTFDPGAGYAGPYYQTAYLIDATGEFRGKYHKRSLMPIGEFMPLEQYFPELHDWARLSKYAAWGNSDAPLLVANDVPIGVLLCYEDIVAEMARRSVALGAEVLVSLVNASAFQDSLALNQHLRLATLRAIENRRTFIRCSGTGISCCISPTGKVLTRIPPEAEGGFTVAATLNSHKTIYDCFGYLFPHGMAIVLGILVIFAPQSRSCVSR